MRRLRAQGERGIAAVEFALIMTVMLTVIFGLIDFGNAYNRKITETEAAREGARLAALGGATASVKTRAQQAASDVSLTTSNILVCYKTATDTSSSCTADTGSPVCTSGATGDAVVTISSVYSFTTPIATFAKLANTSLTITATGRMPCGG